jgi:hypothetical protein
MTRDVLISLAAALTRPTLLTLPLSAPFFTTYLCKVLRNRNSLVRRARKSQLVGRVERRRSKLAILSLSNLVIVLVTFPQEYSASMVEMTLNQSCFREWGQCSGIGERDAVEMCVLDTGCSLRRPSSTVLGFQSFVEKSSCQVSVSLPSACTLAEFESTTKDP